ncbi:MAG: ribbon-helix-helix domain-containing protein [Thermoanaerobaculia bacterium]
MPSKNPRVNTVLPPNIYELVAKLAKKEGVSMSHKVNDLVREALELEEDLGLDAIATKRLSTKGRWIPLAEVKKRLGIS